jgi:hypothetical protein
MCFVFSEFTVIVGVGETRLEDGVTGIKPNGVK